MLDAISDCQVTALEDLAFEQFKIDLLSLATDQERIYGLHKFRADLRDFIAPVKPVESAVSLRAM